MKTLYWQVYGGKDCVYFSEAYHLNELAGDTARDLWFLGKERDEFAERAVEVILSDDLTVHVQTTFDEVRTQKIFRNYWKLRASGNIKVYSLLDDDTVK